MQASQASRGSAPWRMGARIVAAASLALLLEPEGVSAEARPPRVSEEARTTLEAVRSTTHQQRAELERVVRAELERVEAAIAQLKTQSRQASAAARRELERAIRDLEDKHGQASRKLREVPRASAAAWEEFTAALADTLQDLRNAIDHAASQLRQ